MAVSGKRLDSNAQAIPGTGKQRVQQAMLRFGKTPCRRARKMRRANLMGAVRKLRLQICPNPVNQITPLDCMQSKEAPCQKIIA